MKRNKHSEEEILMQKTNLYCFTQDVADGFSDWAEISIQADAEF
jgi:hypothetical protein